MDRQIDRYKDGQIDRQINVQMDRSKIYRNSNSLVINLEKNGRCLSTLYTLLPTRLFSNIFRSRIFDEENYLLGSINQSQKPHQDLPPPSYYSLLFCIIIYFSDSFGFLHFFVVYFRLLYIQRVIHRRQDFDDELNLINMSI